MLPDAMLGDSPPIHQKEFFILIISIRLWGASWSGHTVELYCDNTAVVEVCLHQKPKDPAMAKFLREFLLLVVKYKFVPRAVKIGPTFQEQNCPIIYVRERLFLKFDFH